jgi:hypothetical protein
MCIGGLLGLRADLVGQIPVLTASISDDWLVAIDVQNGTLHWSLDQIIKDGAKPSVGVDAKSVVPASRIVVTPLPQFLAHVLRTRLASIPEAKRLGDLLSGYRLLTSHTLTTDEDRQLAPSYARFVNTIGSFAVNAGINRYCAAVITHDPRLVPTGKFHYALARRKELWSASEDLFKAMGWGTPVAFVPGLAAGSRVVPDDRSISSLHAWMSNQLATASEGDMRDFKSLTAYSNCFVMCVASMLAWALMLRERKVIPIFADAAFGDQACLSLGDKRVGLIKEPHSISICSLVRDLLTSLFQHYQWLEVMLNDCEQECAVILDGVRAILDGKHVPVLALIRRRRLVSLSSKDLEKWWPINLGIKDNGGRHHMQNALRNRHVADTLIDHYARHNNRGRGILSSTSMMSLRKLRAVCDSVDQIAGDLGLAAFPNKFSAGKEGV